MWAILESIKCRTKIYIDRRFCLLLLGCIDIIGIKLDVLLMNKFCYNKMII